MIEQILNSFKITHVVVAVPWFGSKSTVDYIAEGHGKLVYQAEKPDRNERCVFTLEFDSYQTSCGYPARFTAWLDKTFQPSFVQHKTEVRPRFKDMWEMLPVLIDAMDWDFAMSDDHRVWSGGNAALHRIKAVARACREADPGRYEKLIQKHAYDRMKGLSL